MPSQVAKTRLQLSGELNRVSGTQYNGVFDGAPSLSPPPLSSVPPVSPVVIGEMCRRSLAAGRVTPTVRLPVINWPVWCHGVRVRRCAKALCVCGDALRGLCLCLWCVVCCVCVDVNVCVCVPLLPTALVKIWRHEGLRGIQAGLLPMITFQVVRTLHSTPQCSLVHEPLRRGGV